MTHHINGQWYIENEDGDIRPLSSYELLELEGVIGCE